MPALLDPSFLRHTVKHRWHRLRHFLHAKGLWADPWDRYFGCLECEREIARDPEEQALLYPDGYPDPELPLTVKAAREVGLA